MEIAAIDVKKLRDRTGMPFGTCREALAKSEGDMEKAVEILRIGNKDTDNKVEGRDTAEGRIGDNNGASRAMVEISGASAAPQLLREVCMHITAVKPVAAVREQVPKESIDKEMEIARAQAVEAGKNKPANIIDKIAEGKVRT